jgi:hypothetical protein
LSEDRETKVVVFKHPKDIYFIKRLQPIIKVFLKQDGMSTQAVDLVALEREFHNVCQKHKTKKQEMLQASRSYAFKARKKNEAAANVHSSTASIVSVIAPESAHIESIGKVFRNYAVRRYLYLKSQTIEFKKWQDYKKVKSKF